MGIALSIPSSIQRELRAFDPRLRLVWNHYLDLFEVEQRSKLDGRWVNVLYWAAVDERGRYHFRGLPGTAGPIIQRLVTMDTARIAGSTPAARAEYFGRLPARRQEAIEIRRRKWIELGGQFIPDFVARNDGVRQTFGPGPLPSRNRHKIPDSFKRAVKEMASTKLR